MKYSDIVAIVEDQNESLLRFDIGLPREILPQLPVSRSHALVISGIRRCGKSVLLHQFIRKEIKDVFYLNFANIRLYDFETKDFTLLDKVITESGAQVLFLMRYKSSKDGNCMCVKNWTNQKE